MEGYEPSSYGDAIADVYDAWYGDHPDTDVAVAMLASLAARTRSGRVLELGIGSGRLALPLVAKGVEVWGVDASTAMVDQLRAKPGGADIPVAIGDMAAIDLASLDGGAKVGFGVVAVAINTFFNLTTEDAQRACLRRAREVLEDDGVLVIEAFVPDVDRPTNAVEARTVESDHVVLSASRTDPVAQTVNIQMIEIRESGIRLRPLVIRYATPAQLDAMCAAAGLGLRERWSDWNSTPFAEGDTLHVSLYARN